MYVMSVYFMHEHVHFCEFSARGAFVVTLDILTIFSYLYTAHIYICNIIITTKYCQYLQY